MKPIVILILLLCLSTTVVFGQVKIGDNPQNIDASSVLELESTSQVLVITRVTNLQMEAIVPQRGGVVYNTDTQCLHYFNGTEWINLCDAVSFRLTNDPIENITSTISIVDNGGTINLEVAPNSIRSENIVDGGINGDDIQDNSIGESKLGDDSVSANELRQNSVGTSELIDGTIQPIDIANSAPNQVLTTDATGIVNWVDASNVSGVVTDVITITGTGIAGDAIAISPGFQTTVSDNTVAIDEHIVADLDIDDRNEILTNAILDGNDLVLTESGTETRVDLGALNNAGTDSQRIETNNAPGNISIINGNEIVLNVNDADANPANEIQNLSEVLTDGNDAGGSLIRNIGTPIDNQDAVTKAYVDGAITGVGGNIVSTQPNNDIIANLGAFYDDPDNDSTNEIQDLGEVLTDGNDGAGLLIRNIADPVDAQDAATRAFVLANSSGSQNLSQVLAQGNSAGNLQLNDLLDPTLPQDAATKAYVDATVVAAGGGLPTDELITDFSLNTTLLTITENGVQFPVNLDPIFVTEVELAAFSVDDADSNPNNEIQNITSTDNSVTITPSATGNDFDLAVAGGGTDDQNLESATLTGSDLAINIEGGTNVTADLSTLASDAELAAAILVSDTADGDKSDTNEIQNITSTDNSVTITPSATGNDFDLAVAGGGTDDQNLESATLTGSDLAINIEGGTNVTADLSTLASDAELAAAILVSDTADGDKSDTNEIQNITSTDNSVTITPSATGNDFDLAVAGGGTDDQNLESATLTGSDLAINIEGGTNVTADLSTLASDAELAAATALKEDTTNKSNDGTLGGNSADNFPTEQAVKTYVDTQILGPNGDVNLSNANLGQTANTNRTYDLNSGNLIFTGNGSIGIGNGANLPQNKLHVDGEVRSAGYSNSNGTPAEPAYSFTNDTDTGMFRGVTGGGNAPVNWLRFATGGTEAITINTTQQVGIGETNPQRNLHVGGEVQFDDDVYLGGAAVPEHVPDYVFQKYFTGESILNDSYEFQSLNNIERFIKANKHLPGIKSAAQVKADGFWNLSESNIKNLEKIEELFLHTIEQEKKINELKNSNTTMAKEVEALKAQMEEIKKMLTAKEKN